MKVSDMRDVLRLNLCNSSWIDCLQRVVKVRKRALPEIMDLIESKLSDQTYQLMEHITQMTNLFQKIHSIYFHEDRGRLLMNELNNDEYEEFLIHVESNLMEHDDKEDHLPIPVFSYSIPTMNTSFLLHVLLSMGEFETEIDLMQHQSIRECFQYSKLIGKNFIV